MKQNTLAPLGSTYRAVLALALAGSCAYAQSDIPPVETELAPVTVSAHEGIAVPYDQTGVSVTVLDVEELKKEGIYSLTEALTTVPGVYVLPGGGAYQKGNYSKPVVRGMNSEKYLLPMMDGMRLGGLTGANGLVAGNVVSRTPLFGMGALEVVRGAQGAVYGSGAMSGVLFMETPEGKEKPSLTVFNEYGSFDSYTGSATAQGRVDDTAFYVNSTYERTNNNVHFADGSTPTLRHAGKSQSWSESVRLDQYINDKHRLTFTYRREDADYRNYNPASEWSPASAEDFEFRTNLVTLKWQSQVTQRYSMSLMAGYYGNEKAFATSGTKQVLSNVQLEWRNAFQWNEAHRTTAGLAWARSDFSSETAGQKNASTSNLDSVLSVFAEHSVEPVKNWNNTLALRLDESNVYDELLTLRASTSYKFNRERTRVFASVGRGYAAPSSFQKSRASYSDGYTTYHGNPSLDCETNWSVDLGAEQEYAKNHFAGVTLFWIRTEDGIVSQFSDWWDQCHYANSESHWTNQGVELALRGTFEKQWNTGYRVAYTLAQPKSSDDAQLAHSARQTWSADVHTSPTGKLTTGIGLSAVVGRTDWGGSRLDNYLVLRWYANYEVNERLSVHLRVENLTNQKFVLDDSSMGPAADWVNPGAAVYAGCTVKF